MNITTVFETWKTFSLLKKAMISVGGIFLLAIIIPILLLVVAFINSTLGTGHGGSMSIPGMSTAYNSNGDYKMAARMAAPSYRDTSNGYSPQESFSPSPTKAESEKYELSSYSASINTRNIEDDCAKIQALKADASVIFLQADTSKTNCWYSFKAEKDGVQKVLNTLKALDPESLNENIQTIAGSLTNYQRRQEILEKQLGSVDTTLKNAIDSYEKLSSLAVASRDAQSLTIAINNKIDIIDRLSTKKLSIEEQLRSISYSSSDDKTSTQYAHFSVTLTKDSYVDFDQLTASWKYETKRLLSEINTSLQDLTLGFFSVFLVLIKYTLYLLIAIVFIKYIKRTIVWIWNR